MAKRKAQADDPQVRWPPSAETLRALSTIADSVRDDAVLRTGDTKRQDVSASQRSESLPWTIGDDVVLLVLHGDTGTIATIKAILQDTGGSSDRFPPARHAVRHLVAGFLAGNGEVEPRRAYRVVDWGLTVALLEGKRHEPERILSPEIEQGSSLPPDRTEWLDPTNWPFPEYAAVVHVYVADTALTEALGAFKRRSPKDKRSKSIRADLESALLPIAHADDPPEIPAGLPKELHPVVRAIQNAPDTPEKPKSTLVVSLYLVLHRALLFHQLEQPALDRLRHKTWGDGPRKSLQVLRAKHGAAAAAHLNTIAHPNTRRAEARVLVSRVSPDLKVESGLVVSGLVTVGDLARETSKGGRPAELVGDSARIGLMQFLVLELGVGEKPGANAATKRRGRLAAAKAAACLLEAFVGLRIKPSALRSAWYRLPKELTGE